MDEAFEAWLKSRGATAEWTRANSLWMKEIFAAGYEAGLEQGEDDGWEKARIHEAMWGNINDN